jgi:hypothetical protein
MKTHKLNTASNFKGNIALKAKIWHRSRAVKISPTTMFAYMSWSCIAYKLPDDKRFQSIIHSILGRDFNPYRISVTSMDQ